VGIALKKRGVRFVFDMRGFWADERVEGGLWNLANPIYRAIFHWLKAREKEFLAAADHVVVLTAAARREILRWPGFAGLEDVITAIPCSVDTNFFDPLRVSEAQRARLRERLGLAQKDRVLVYLGSIGTWYLLDEMLGFFKRYLAVEPSARFLFITADDPTSITCAAEALGLPAGRIVIASAPRAEVPSHLALGDFGVFFIRPTYSKIGSSPTKQGEMMAMGLPSVCNRGVGDVDEIVLRRRAGVLVDRFDDPSYDAAIAQLKADRFSPPEIIAGARADFGLESAVACYRRIYEAVLEPDGLSESLRPAQAEA
jgi:glycosyltransferase involved in cell wall biosynthesis